MSLVVKDLEASVEDKDVLKGISLSVAPGEVVALMGPNGSGKSTLAYTVAGHPRYRSSQTELSLDGTDMAEMPADERARLGLFLASQYPVAIPGVSVREAMLSALRARNIKKLSALELKNRIEAAAKELGIEEELLKRGLNDGFSGGEKKKMEILQMEILAPKYAILDETDSGLDIDALKIVAEGAARLAAKNKTGILVITHYQRLLNYLKPDRVLIMREGKIAAEGGTELVLKLEKEGYQLIGA